MSFSDQTDELVIALAFALLFLLLFLLLMMVRP